MKGGGVIMVLAAGLAAGPVSGSEDPAKIDQSMEALNQASHALAQTLYQQQQAAGAGAQA